MTDTFIVSVDEVRDYLELNQIPSTSRYSDATIGSNILAAQQYLERRTGRFFVDRPATSWTIPGATMLRAQVAIPGFRAFSTVTWGGSALIVGFAAGDNASCWALPDPLNSGVFVALQFRAWRADSDRPWYLADANWWDKLLDSPYYPGNWGGGYAWTSMPDDLIITGDGGYAQGTEPYDLRHAIKVLASFYTQRPPSILADTIITPAGAILNTSRLPSEVVDFIVNWKVGGEQVVSM
jgi:hypothetical protein